MTGRETVQSVVRFLGAIALVGLLGVIYLVDRGRAASSVAVVATIAGAAAGSLGTLLASTRTIPSGEEVKQALAGLEPAAVTIAGQDEPLAVVDAPAESPPIPRRTR